MIGGKGGEGRGWSEGFRWEALERRRMRVPVSGPDDLEGESGGLAEEEEGRRGEVLTDS